MGGDEFVIFAKLKSDEEALALKKQIEYNVRQFNIKSKEPFHFSFSLGIAKFNGKNTDAFLSAMDDSMYETKNMHRLMQKSRRVHRLFYFAQERLFLRKSHTPK